MTILIIMYTCIGISLLSITKRSSSIQYESCLPADKISKLIFNRNLYKEGEWCQFDFSVPQVTYQVKEKDRVKSNYQYHQNYTTEERWQQMEENKGGVHTHRDTDTFSSFLL